MRVSLDPELQRFGQVPAPYLPGHAGFFMTQVAMAGQDSGQRAEFA